MGRTPCCEKNGLKKGPWTPEEDQKLVDYIQKNGHGSWRTLPKNAGLARCGKSCRLRWTNYLRPDIKRGRFSFEEEETIIQLHSILGNKWSAIAARLPGRTDNEIKNYWNTRIRKRLLRMGIDPVTHSPRLDLSSLLTPPLYNPTQFHVSTLLGIESLVNPDLLRLATNLLSSQCQNSNLFHQNIIGDSQFSNPQTQEQQPFLSSFFQSQNLQNLVQQIPCSTSTSSAQLLNEPQLMQANVGTFPQHAAMNPWQSGNQAQVNVVDQNYMPPPSFNYESSGQFPQQLLSSEDCQELLHQNNPSYFNLPSMSSTPASSPTNLNSSSTYINGCSTEEDRDSNCSNLFNNFHIPDLLDVSDYM